MTGLTIDRIIEVEDSTQIHVGPLLFTAGSFTRSNGTVFARLYERLTKASRRRYSKEKHQLGKRINTTFTGYAGLERAYRRGVKDAYNALRDELRT